MENTVILEIFDKNSIGCLLKSIPVKEILEGLQEVQYYKMEINDELKEKYQLSEFPTMLVFKS
jgi:hypothetical protein